MKPYTFEVTFSTGIKTMVSAYSKEQARILAQAEQIKLGNNYYVSTILKIED